VNDADQAWDDEMRSEREHLAHVRACLAAMLSATEQFRPVGADKIATELLERRHGSSTWSCWCRLVLVHSEPLPSQLAP